MMYQRFYKRLLDVLFAGLGLLLLSPLLLLVACVLGVANQGAGVFFFQERPGKHGRIFKIYKFKTMTDKRFPDGTLLPDAERLTPIGRLIRSTSMDELPQLWNVLKGDMSWIGPRPLLPQYLSLYTTEQARRHEVLPGITGWAQCHGRNAISWREKFELDVWYVDHLSWKVDWEIFWLTIKKVLRREDIAHEGNVTMKAFNGWN